HRYRHELLNFLTRFLGKRAVAEDIFQETFLQVHLSADTFDLDRRFKPWLFTIAANKGRDHMRRRARRPAAPLDAPIGGRGSDDGQSFVDILQDDLPLPGEAVEQAEQAERVQRTVDEMPEHLREILLLAYFQRFSYKQITEVLEIPLGTVKSRLHSAVGAFAKLWKQQNPARERT
ncbi:MAG: sigma-70 family RNA polymerase sigma factor, partial [Phycisphaerae bacterium]|nr:sigma-70 family RNA polymerase sigma factor [Phycisphaerae bacterium]